MGYTVPQKLRLDAVDKAEIFFRVRQVYGNASIRVMDGDKQLAAFKREHMAPGEMERIALPRKLLDMAAGNTLTVEIAEA